MPKIHVNKSILIHAPAEKVFQTLSDFHHWPNWSPWLICEPEATVEVHEDGKYYEWNGKRIGSGNMKVINESATGQIDYDLNFLKPWKSSSKVQFFYKPEGDSTRVSWTMDSSLPFFMFWMKKMMTAFVGADYERGLNMLKEYVEEGKIKSKLDFKGYGTYPGCNYIAIKTDTTAAQVGPKMEADLAKLFDFANQNPNNIAGQAFSIYHKWDMVKGKVSYTSGIPVKSIPDNLPDGIISGNIPETKTYTLRHTGSYQHLGNAWTTLYMMHRNKEFKPRKGIHPFEQYVNMPGEVAVEELVTDISFAVK